MNTVNNASLLQNNIYVLIISSPSTTSSKNTSKPHYLVTLISVRS